MTMEFIDGFDHYGVGAAGRLAMLDGVYAEISASTTGISATNPRTGGYAYRMQDQNNAHVLRRVLSGAKTVVGLGVAFYLSNLPTSNNLKSIFQFRDAANSVQVTLMLQSTGVIEAFRGVSTVSLGVSATPVIVAGAFQHIEAKVSFSQTVGTIEVRVNGVTVLNLTGLDTVESGLVECSQVTVFNGTTSALSGVTDVDIDDYFCWNNDGTQNNDFLGDRRVRTIFPNADTATADWGLTGAASGFDCINDAAPDNETTYISALPLVGSPPTPLTSIFDLEATPAGVGSIAAVQTYVRMRKTEAGDTNVKISMLSGGDESAGADRAITEAYTYWMDMHELNPDTGTPWSETSLNAAQLQIKRTV